ncbi:diflavin oxidoreductase [Blattabacterium cuenoti]|uniref:diflavin oxidoreductase n=1 Tax=Blattabacterium cuenoti TaxID=1653831 RepID=UPI00163C4A5B|nr:flavodoxin domain-containing protein [Blattabacterium cuenoti]
MLQKSNNKIFIDLIKNSSKKEIIWMSGFISGYLYDFNRKKNNDNNNLNKEKITIVYSSETGNAEDLAFTIYNKIKQKKLNIKLFDLNDYCLSNLYKEDYLLIIISTHGDGDPPNSGKKFFKFIHTNIYLNNLKYSVVALGDKTYKNFCKAGENIDKQLEIIGGIRILKLCKCDVSYIEDSKQWLKNILEFFLRKNKITIGIISKNIIINKNIDRKIHHIEIKSSLEYLPGDSVGIYPENTYDEVCKILKIFGEKDCKKNYDIFLSLKKEKSIYNLSERFLKDYSLLLSNNENIIISKEIKWDIFNLINRYPIDQKNIYSLKKIINIMDPIKPRLYSISSSPKKHLNEIHITVLLNKFQKNGKIKYGYCSNFLSNLKKGDQLRFFIYKNNFFKLPNRNEDIIMIGPGTGIAPFRSFLYERELTKSTGKNWLFFGDQYYKYDYLYKSEIKNWIKNGVLDRLNISFSRDQKKKIYVQDKIWENREKFFHWIKNGAYIYICGKKNPMSVDVENTILRVIKEIGKEDPILFINKMKKIKKYVKDVY